MADVRTQGHRQQMAAIHVRKRRLERSVSREPRPGSFHLALGLRQARVPARGRKDVCNISWTTERNPVHLPRTRARNVEHTFRLGDGRVSRLGNTESLARAL